MLLGQAAICLQKTADPYLLLSTSINSKCIKDLNIRPETMQLGHERARNIMETTGIGKDFHSRAPAAQQLREKVDKWDFMKLKIFCTTKEMFCKLKRPPTDWEKIFASYTSKD
jgi:hypothetical protein